MIYNDRLPMTVCVCVYEYPYVCIKWIITSNDLRSRTMSTVQSTFLVLRISRGDTHSHTSIHPPAVSVQKETEALHSLSCTYARIQPQFVIIVQRILHTHTWPLCCSSHSIPFYMLPPNTRIICARMHTCTPPRHRSRNSHAQPMQDSLSASQAFFSLE